VQFDHAFKTRCPGYLKGPATCFRHSQGLEHGAACNIYRNLPSALGALGALLGAVQTLGRSCAHRPQDWCTQNTSQSARRDRFENQHSHVAPALLCLGPHRKRAGRCRWPYCFVPAARASSATTRHASMDASMIGSPAEMSVAAVAIGSVRAIGVVTGSGAGAASGAGATRVVYGASASSGAGVVSGPVATSAPPRVSSTPRAMSASDEAPSEGNRAAGSHGRRADAPRKRPPDEIKGDPKGPDERSSAILALGGENRNVPSTVKHKGACYTKVDKAAVIDKMR